MTKHNPNPWILRSVSIVLLMYYVMIKLRYNWSELDKVVYDAILVLAGVKN